MFTKKLLREIKCHFCDKITQGKQIYSSATAKDAKVMFFFPIRHSLTTFYWDLDLCQFFLADTMTDGGAEHNPVYS